MTDEQAPPTPEQVIAALIEMEQARVFYEKEAARSRRYLWWGLVPAIGVNLAAAMFNLSRLGGHS